MRTKRQIISVICSALLLLNNAVVFVCADTAGAVSPALTGAQETQSIISSYDKYSENYSGFVYGEKKVLTDSDISEKSETAEDGVVIPDDGFATWRFTVESDCLYTVKVKYMSVEASSGNMELEFNIDGEIPFSEVSLVSFERCYKQAEGEFAKNKNGNNIKPDVEEVFLWNEKAITDASGYKTEPFAFGFGAGEHLLTLKGSRGKIAIAEITLEAPEELESYKGYSNSLSKYSPAKAKTIESNTTVTITIKGLKAKTTYYVRIRTYKIVNSKKYYSAWSSVKSVKTK